MCLYRLAQIIDRGNIGRLVSRQCMLPVAVELEDIYRNILMDH